MTPKDKPMKCPDCDGEGFVIGETTGYGHACDGTQEDCDKNCPIPVPEQTQEQCPTCNGTGEINET